MINQISMINGIVIVAVNENDEILIPIKPLCEALEIDPDAQRQKIREDEILNSVAVLSTATGADNKQYEMLCLPLRYIYGWLFTINPKNVAPQAKDSVRRYRQECYDVLYNHFTASMQRTIQQNETEIKLLQQISDAKDSESNARAERRKAESALDKLRKERLNPQPSLFNS